VCKSCRDDHDDTFLAIKRKYNVSNGESAKAHDIERGLEKEAIAK
jgi:hypothetical protein